MTRCPSRKWGSKKSSGFGGRPSSILAGKVLDGLLPLSTVSLKLMNPAIGDLPTAPHEDKDVMTLDVTNARRQMHADGMRAARCPPFCFFLSGAAGTSLRCRVLSPPSPPTTPANTPRPIPMSLSSSSSSCHPSPHEDMVSSLGVIRVTGGGLSRTECRIPPPFY